MVNTKVNLCGITLDNPVIPASGTFGYGYEFAELYDINTLGTFSFAEELPKMREVFHKPVMANVSGFAVEDYAYTVEKLDSEECIGWFEVNVSCPNVKQGCLEFGLSPNALFELTKKIRKRQISFSYLYNNR